MISYLKGTIKEVESDQCLVLVQDVGYTVYVPTLVLETFKPEQEVELYTYQYVREDTLDLYGFIEKTDLNLFDKLIHVSGVGARTGLTLLSQYAAEDIRRAIIHGDISLLSSVSGVGKKTAERIVLDLKESIAVAAGVEAVEESGTVTEASALDALLALGYSQSEALASLKGIDQTASLEEQVRQALKQASKE